MSAHFHDAAAALLVDGRVVAAAAEERFSRQKHDANFPCYAAQFCLEEGGFSAQDLDAVVFYEDPHVKFTRVLASTLAGFPRTAGPFIAAMKGWIGKKLFIRNEISAALDVHPRRIHFVSHHASHAAHAFSSSGFDEAAVVCVDAVGEWTCSSIGHGRDGAVKPLEQLEYPHSLGLLYAAFTGWLGLTPNSDECSTMAIAAFGRANRVEDVRKILKLHDDGTYELDGRYFDFLATGRLPLTPRFIDLFGPAATRAELDALDAFEELPAELPEPLRRYVDVAASLQVVLEDAILGLLRRARDKTGANDLCLAGGVALNCVAVRRIIDEGLFERVFIPPDPGDGGGAIGAAMAHAVAGGDRVAEGAGTPYLGKEYPAGPVLDMVASVDEETWARTGKGAAATRVPRSVEVERLTSQDALITRVVDLLCDEQVVGWVQGRFENGPRALGNRSLLADPSSLSVARRMSATIKRRAPYRPYAFAVAEEDAARAVELPVGELAAPLRWMQATAAVRPDSAERVRAATHADGTTRPQVCGASDNPRFHALLTAYGQATGLSAILNTSLNERGAPMVASPVEALAMFARTDMDALVLHDAIVRKVW